MFISYLNKELNIWFITHPFFLLSVVCWVCLQKDRKTGFYKCVFQHNTSVLFKEIKQLVKGLTHVACSFPGFSRIPK